MRSLGKYLAAGASIVVILGSVATATWAVQTKADADDVKQLEARVNTIENNLAAQTAILKRVEASTNHIKIFLMGEPQ
ncbi:MAG TPA: hypothetical protein VFG83_16860 [Kofleriaceae bacterium]|nr:hypothetical protein [Kofleriaceae bacterium]